MIKALGFKVGEADLYLQDIEMPEPGNKEVRVKVYCSAVNRSDILQRKGYYSPPKHISSILGLEASGVVDKVGPGCPCSIKTGQKVLALVTGGANAEYVVCRHEQLMPMPKRMTHEKAAGIPEVWLTAFQLLHTIGKLTKTDTVLIHAGGSGVGTAAVQLVKQAGATAIVTAGSKEKIDLAKSLGAKEGINYKEDGVDEKLLKATDGKGVDLILDCIGESMFNVNIKAIKLDGRWISYGILGGHIIKCDFGALLLKRVNLHFTTLRFRSVEYQEKLIKDFSKLAIPLFENETFKPIIDTVLPLSDAAEGHKMMEENKNKGKIILKVRE